MSVAPPSALMRNTVRYSVRCYPMGERAKRVKTTAPLTDLIIQTLDRVNRSRNNHEF